MMTIYLADSRGVVTWLIINPIHIDLLDSNTNGCPIEVTNENVFIREMDGGVAIGSFWVALQSLIIRPRFTVIFGDSHVERRSFLIFTVIVPDHQQVSRRRYPGNGCRRTRRLEVAGLHSTPCLSFIF